jgi:hypothetical protein
MLVLAKCFEIFTVYVIKVRDHPVFRLLARILKFRNLLAPFQKNTWAIVNYGFSSLPFVCMNFPTPLLSNFQKTLKTASFRFHFLIFGNESLTFRFHLEMKRKRYHCFCLNNFTLFFSEIGWFYRHTFRILSIF